MLSEKFKAEQDIHMPFELQEEHTIGLGIDTYKHLFYVFYDKYYAYYQLNRTNSLRKLNARIWGAYDHTTNDEISVNFGAFPFKYNISGFTPWENNQKEKTCYHNLRKGVSPLLSLMIAVILC